MKRTLIIATLLFLTNVIWAQGYNKAIGLRGGLSPGIEYRFYTDDINSYKLLLSWRNEGLQLHALKEFHRFDLFDFSENLIFIYGVGIHAGYESWNVVRYYENTSWYNSRAAMLAGVDGLVGVEYVFNEVPISLGLEAKPYFDVFGRNMFRIQPFDFAFTIKYLF